MTLEQYKQAKFIREKIDHLNVKMLQIEKMKNRKDDEEFELARQLAHDAMSYAMGRLEQDFNAI